MEMELPASGFVLAGGRSSRMGADKAMLRFDGTPLVQIALDKLRFGCRRVAILGNRPELGDFGMVLPDGLTEAGPLAGIATALRRVNEEETARDWVMLMPVDVPAVPGTFLMAWAWQVARDPTAPAAGCFRVEGRVQPLVSMLHRELLPYVAAAVDAGERKVLAVLEAAAAQTAADGLGTRRSGLRVDEPKETFWRGFWRPSELERATEPLWFANVNTPEEFARVEHEFAEAKKSLERTGKE
ncbi:molybdenum cofactor guanylyltransferase [Granulicella sibirica]|uniref:Probable molybdenum cofactor guanylyltransferase n=1 Tax=Granulicella sibirica TaxID=2479048 RepID=A0A4Q0T0M6_9BACT|nr:molybdenum cofactor guanylyltransferase [Granulicella sibirica]RXH57125.1 Molybdopterin-guanine dinucleotide biosynthesis protein MobA [Granulicella sibirica]